MLENADKSERFHTKLVHQTLLLPLAVCVTRFDQSECVICRVILESEEIVSAK